MTGSYWHDLAQFGFVYGKWYLKFKIVFDHSSIIGLPSLALLWGMRAAWVGIMSVVIVEGMLITIIMKTTIKRGATLNQLLNPH